MLPIVFTIASGLAGVLVGLVFFGGLWWTVQAATRSRHPYRLLFISWVLRMAVLLVAVRLLIGEGHWERGVAAVVGILVARTILLWKLAPPTTPSSSSGDALQAAANPEAGPDRVGAPGTIAHQRDPDVR